MNWLTVAWSMSSATCFTLAVVHLLVWTMHRRQRVTLLFALMASMAGVIGLGELGLLSTVSVAQYHTVLRWQNVCIFVLVVSMVWAIQIHFSTGRRWLASTITAFWTICIVANFLSPHNLTYSEISDLQRVPTFGGEFFTIVDGVRNPWVNLADLASLLIVVFVSDASIRLWRQGGSRRAIIVGGSITFFVLAAGIHTLLVDAGIVRTPYMISFAYLAIVAAFSYELGYDAVRASELSLEVENNERRWRELLEGIELVVVGTDPGGRINFVNPYFERVTGYGAAEVIGRDVRELVVEEERAELDKRFHDAVESGPRPQSIWKFRRKDGGSLTIAFSNVRLQYPDGAFAGIVGVGENISDRLKAEIRARDLTGRLINSQEQERSRVARDLHDDITQRLARLSIDAARVEERAGAESAQSRLAATIREGLVRLGEDVHSIAYRLHPTVLEDLGLAEALASDCERFSHREGVPCELRKSDLPARLPREVSVCLYRVAQEALRNIGRHAEAKRVEVSLRSVDGGIQLGIRDDGMGFDPNRQREKPSMGLASMQERVSLLRGDLDIESSPGNGATVVAWVPLERGPEAK